jgi:antibiotic biosynthesis monooxygenase
LRETGEVLVISRFRYDDELADRVQAELGTCLEQLEQLAGFVTGSVGRAADDPALWVLQTRWENVGSYRRALSSYDIKMSVVPLLSRAIDEPSAFEVIIGEGATVPNESRPRQT